MDDLRYWLLLQSIEGIGPVTFRNLLEKFTSPKLVFESDQTTLQTIPRLTGKIIDQIIASKNKIYEIDAILEQLRNRNIKIISLDEPSYPTSIKSIVNLPPLLYVSQPLPTGRTFGIIGTRDASQYGKEQAFKFAKELASADFTIVSGYAKGIDIAAHWGAVANNQNTVAVLPTGILKFQMYQEITEFAAKFHNYATILSEFYPLSEWSVSNALLRNRITAALSDYLLVVESGESGGTLNTVEHARQLGKTVFLYKDVRSATDEKLIALGAIQINNCNEIIKYLDTENI